MMRRILLLFLLTFNFFLLTFNFFLLNIIIRLLELLNASISGKKSSSLLAFITSFIVRFSTIFVIFKKSLLYFYFKLEKYWLDFHIQLSLNHFFNFIFKFKKEITQFWNRRDKYGVNSKTKWNKIKIQNHYDVCPFTVDHSYPISKNIFIFFLNTLKISNFWTPVPIFKCYTILKSSECQLQHKPL